MDFIVKLYYAKVLILDLAIMHNITLMRKLVPYLGMIATTQK